MLQSEFFTLVKWMIVQTCSCCWNISVRYRLIYGLKHASLHIPHTLNQAVISLRLVASFASSDAETLICSVDAADCLVMPAICSMFCETSSADADCCSVAAAIRCTMSIAFVEVCTIMSSDALASLANLTPLSTSSLPRFIASTDSPAADW